MARFEPWLMYGLIGCIAFGINIIVLKLSFKAGINPFMASAFFNLGAFLVSALAFLIFRQQPSGTASGVLLAVLAGAVWSVGLVSVSYGISQNFEVSKMSVIINSNTVIAVLLSIIVLKELQNPSDLWRTLLGAILVVGGAIIVSVR